MDNMDDLIGIFVISYIILCLIVASIGSDRKIGYGGTFLVCLFLSPIIGALFAIASERKTAKSYNKRSNLEINRNMKVADDYNRSGLKLYNSGKYRDAINNFNAGLKYHPRHTLILFNLALCYSQIKNKEKSFYYLQESIDSGFSNYTQIETGAGFEFLRQQSDFDQFMNKINNFNEEEESTEIRDQNIEQGGSQSIDRITLLEKLASLKERGLLTDEEFSFEKNKIIQH